MATLDQLAIEYARRILNSKQKMIEADIVAKEINELVYTQTNQEISIEDKQEIVMKLNGHLKSFPENGMGLFEKDNKEFLSLVAYINSQLRGRKK